MWPIVDDNTHLKHGIWDLRFSPSRSLPSRSLRWERQTGIITHDDDWILCVATSGQHSTIVNLEEGISNRFRLIFWYQYCKINKFEDCDILCYTGSAGSGTIRTRAMENSPIYEWFNYYKCWTWGYCIYKHNITINMFIVFILNASSRQCLCGCVCCETTARKWSICTWYTYRTAYSVHVYNKQDDQALSWSEFVYGVCYGVCTMTAYTHSQINSGRVRGGISAIEGSLLKLTY